MILVTGGAGFIGANFVLDWCAAGHTTGLAEPDLEPFGRRDLPRAVIACRGDGSERDCR